jgi:hypothetical protein
LAKQMFLQVAAGWTLAGYLAFWLGLAVGHYVPCLTLGSHSARPPCGLVQAGEVLVELFSHGTIPPNDLAGARAAAIYSNFIDLPPPPQGGGQVALGLEQGLDQVVGSGLPLSMVDKMFLLIHNILPLRGRLASIGVMAEGSCPHCGALETTHHFFQLCPRIADLWDGLYARLVTMVTGLPSDMAFPVSMVSVERCVVAHVASLVLEFWETRSCLRPPSCGDLVAFLRVHFPALRPLF